MSLYHSFYFFATRRYFGRNLGSEQEAKRLEIYKIFENDLIYGRKGDIGRGIFATKEREGYLFGPDCICVRVIGKSILPKYLFYFLTSPNSKRLLSAQSHGTTMLGIYEKNAIKNGNFHP